METRVWPEDETVIDNGYRQDVVELGVTDLKG